MHLEGHQVFEAFEAFFGVEDGLGDRAEGHGLNRLSANHNVGAPGLAGFARPASWCIQKEE